MTESEVKQPVTIHWILDHPKLAGFLAAVALAVGFSPKASGMASWICIAIAIVFGIAMLVGIKEKRSWGIKKTGTSIALLVIGLLLFGGWLTDVKEAMWGPVHLKSVDSKPSNDAPTEGFHVEFRTQFVNLTRQVQVAPFWVLYLTRYGQTVAPVALLAELEITSLYPYAVSISTYQMSIRTSCGWVRLEPIDLRSHRVLFAFENERLDKTQWINLPNPFDVVWERPISPRVAILGSLIFDAYEKCNIGYGDHVQFRFTITDSTGRPPYTYDSPDQIIQQGAALDNSVGHGQRTIIRFANYTIDASKAHRTIYTDPLPRSIPKNELNAGITNASRSPEE